MFFFFIANTIFCIKRQNRALVQGNPGMIDQSYP